MKMARTQTLRQNTINQFIDCINNQTITFPLPTISVLADTFNVSRTTIRAVLHYLHEIGILQLVDEEYQLARKPEDADKVNAIFEKRSVQDKKIEQYFYYLISHRKILPGDKFSEIQLAQEAKVSPVVVREFLLRFLHYGLINNYKKGEWELIVFEQNYAEKLYEFRSLLEISAIKSFIKLPEDHIYWTNAKELLQRHKQLQIDMQNHFTDFSNLDREFHLLILSASHNPFFVQSFDLISVIFHFHYQWDSRDLKERNSIAVSEHIAVLVSLLQRNETNAVEALSKHLQTAQHSMRESISRTLRIKNR